MPEQALDAYIRGWCSIDKPTCRFMSYYVHVIEPRTKNTSYVCLVLALWHPYDTRGHALTETMDMSCPTVGSLR